MPSPARSPKPKFSIIIPSYNVADYLPACLDSLIAQSFTDWEAIVVEDASTDASFDILHSYYRERRIHVTRQAHAGLSAARNNGVTKAKGEYLIFLDSDDFLTPHALADINSAITADPTCQIDLLRFQVQDFHPDGRFIKHPEAPFATTSGLSAWPLLAAYHYTENAWAYAYRAEFFKRNHFKYTVGCIAEDFGLTPLIIARAATVKSIPQICYNYRQRPGSIMSSKKKLKSRVVDSFLQLESLLPTLAAIPGAEPITHYLVLSFLTLAAGLPEPEFQKYHSRAVRSGFMQYIKPSNAKSLPRSIFARSFPRLFYRCYHRRAA